MLRHEVFEQLVDALSNNFIDLERATGVARDAGLNPAKIKYDSTPENYWRNIVDEAEKQQLTEELLNKAVKDYPNESGLRSACQAYRKWVEDGRQELTEIKPPPGEEALFLQPIPTVQNFIGRAVELDVYQNKLSEEHFVMITGLEGVGKTYLGVTLARKIVDREQDIFWFNFDRSSNNNSETLLQALAEFLDVHGWSDPRKYYEGERTTHKSLDLLSRLKLLLNGLRNGRYVICLDNVELVKDEVAIVDIFKFIQEQGRNKVGELPAFFIIIGNELPHEMEYLVLEPLRGFSEADAIAFIESRNLRLPGDFVHRLWELTEGNPMFLHLCVTILQTKKGEDLKVNELLEQMADESNIRNFLMHKILSRFPYLDKDTLYALSIFPSAFERETATEFLYRIGVAEANDRINALIDKWILSEPADGFLQIHKLVREFCYRDLDLKEKESLHKTAAEYFEKEKKDYLSAGYHFIESGAKTQAVDFLTGHVQQIVNAGGARTLQGQLSRFRLSELTLQQKAAIDQAKGDAFNMIGEYQPALEAYEKALLQTIESHDRARLLSRIGEALYLSGNYQKAKGKLTESIKLYNETDLLGKSRTQCTLGWACYRLRQLKTAERQFDECYQNGIKLNDDILLARAALGLGLLAWERDELQKAQNYFHDSYVIFRDYGDRVGEIEVLINQGIVDSARGELDRERSRYLEAERIAEQVGDWDSLRLIYNNLGNLHQILRDYDQAANFYRKLEEMARKTDHKPMISTAAIGQADAYLAEGDTSQALVSAKEALRVAKEIGQSVELAASYRVLGDIRLDQGYAQKAKRWFERSIRMLQEVKDKEEMAKARHGLEQASSCLSTSLKGGKENYDG